MTVCIHPEVSRKAVIIVGQLYYERSIVMQICMFSAQRLSYPDAGQVAVDFGGRMSPGCNETLATDARSKQGTADAVH